jgi:hypothetical protein
MSFSNDALIVLLARRRNLYEQLGLMDRQVAAVQNSPFFSTRLGNAIDMGDSIENLEAQIADINEQITEIRGPLPDEAGLTVDSA